jgi:hypothetical protein
MSGPYRREFGSLYTIVTRANGDFIDVVSPAAVHGIQAKRWEHRNAGLSRPAFKCRRVANPG